MEDSPGDLGELSSALGQIVTVAQPIRFTSQVSVDPDEVYDVLDSIRAALPRSIIELRWYQQRREELGDPPLGTSLDGPLDVLDGVDVLDELVRKARPLPTSTRVRVSQERLSAGVDRVRSWIDPFVRELVEYRRLYPEAKSELDEARNREPSELVRLITELDTVFLDAKPIPLTFEKRIDRSVVLDLINKIRAAGARDGTDSPAFRAALDHLDHTVKTARKVPFTNQIRLDFSTCGDLIDAVWVALTDARPTDNAT